MISKIQVENIKCGGCMNSISNKLNEQTGVIKVGIDLEEGLITLDHLEDVDVLEVEKTLAKMGYPPTGHNNIGAKAKSYVSCMVGRMSD